MAAGDPIRAAAPNLREPDAAEILASIGEVPYLWDIETDALWWGRGAAQVMQVSDPGMLTTGRGFAQLVDAQSGTTRFDAVMHPTSQDKGPGVPYQVQYALRLPAGSPDQLWLEDSGRWFAGPHGTPVRAHGVVRVINERHAREQKLLHLSRYDALTGEMNRASMTEVLGTVLEEAVRFRSSVGFMLVAIDNLGRINEGYGFDVADEVIAAVAKRIRRQLRGKDHFGRMSGNKFGVILHNCTPDDLVVAAERLLTSARDEVVQTPTGAVAVTITIGGVTAPRYARTVREILIRAQEALDRARSKRRGSFQAYAPNLEREAQRQESALITDEIINALNERRVTLVYEPVVGIRSRAPAFYECLMRLTRADGTLMPVADIVPIAERLGLVRLLDHRVLELALEEMAQAPALKASVNVSAASTCDPDWWAGLAAMLRAHPGVAPRLTVEITETAAIHDIDETRGFVTRVKDLGCRIAIDDFGAGHTSFRNLRKLGVDLVKIDGAFVQNLRRSEDDRAFVHTLVDLARRLGLETVAEWVQDEESAAMLGEWGCDYLQGALVGLACADRPWLEASGPCAASP